MNRISNISWSISRNDEMFLIMEEETVGESITLGWLLNRLHRSNLGIKVNQAIFMNEAIRKILLYKTHQFLPELDAVQANRLMKQNKGQILEEYERLLTVKSKEEELAQINRLEKAFVNINDLVATELNFHFDYERVIDDVLKNASSIRELELSSEIQQLQKECVSDEGTVALLLFRLSTSKKENTFKDETRLRKDAYLYRLIREVADTELILDGFSSLKNKLDYLSNHGKNEPVFIRFEGNHFIDSIRSLDKLSLDYSFKKSFHLPIELDLFCFEPVYKMEIIQKLFIENIGKINHTISDYVREEFNHLGRIREEKIEVGLFLSDDKQLILRFIEEYYQALTKKHSSLKIKSAILSFSLDHTALLGEQGWTGKMLEIKQEVERIAQIKEIKTTWRPIPELTDSKNVLFSFLVKIEI